MELIPWLYLKGVSTSGGGDFQEALQALLGPACPGLSATTVTRLKQKWETEYPEWSRRDLSEERYVYLWADGVHFNVRLEEDRTCILVLMGATAEGKKELLAVQDGYRESEQSWKTLLLDVKQRGLKIDPKLATGHGAFPGAGFWKALPQVFPAKRPQRCWVHKTANVLDKRLEPLREQINKALGTSWEQWEIPREWEAAWSTSPVGRASSPPSGRSPESDARPTGGDDASASGPAAGKMPAPPKAKEAQDAHAKWWEQRIARQKEIDASIAARADHEYLYDKPYEDKKKVRVAGPFTVESLSPHRTLWVFQTPFSWKSLGVDVRGRSQSLKINYRTSHQIRRQADILLPVELSDVDQNSEKRKGTVSVFNGPKPRVELFEDEDAEVAAVAAWLRKAMEGDVSPHEIGVFVRTVEQLPRAIEAVAAAGLSQVTLDGHQQPEAGAASVATMHLAKGMEFRAVAVMACDEDVLPLQERVEAIGDEADLEEVYNTERHLLYVACTRARDRLLVTGLQPGSEFVEDFAGS